jgi:hypothetical protein
LCPSPRTIATIAILTAALAPSVRNILSAEEATPSRAVMKAATSWRTASMPWLLA